MKDLAKLFNQIQKMQEKLKEVKEELGNRVVEASAGGDMVVVKMNCKNELISIKIKKEVVNPDDVEMLEDLIMAAINEARRKAAEIVSEELSKMSAGINIPGLDDFINLS
jgi:DNA-binding YbaB/EbfC family protein